MGESFTHDQIFDRDGWICQLCFAPIDWRRFGRDPLAPSLDHVVLLNSGGVHSRDNVWAAHFGCNSRKRDRDDVLFLSPTVGRWLGMAGRGPAPKDPSKLAGHGAAKARQGEMRVINVDPVPQPDLVSLLGEVNEATGLEWHPATLELWDNLGVFPSLGVLQGAQWAVLARAMMLDDAFMRGELRHASELRLQLQKFGIAPDDVARLRIVFAQADEADSKRPQNISARERRSGIRVIKPEKEKTA